MPFKHNSTGIEPSTFQPIPAGEYKFVIQNAKEKKSKKTGADMIEATLQVIENTDHHGKTLKHYVVFIPAGEKGDGMSVHFRKCIGVPYGGDDEVDASEWVGKKLRAKLKVEERKWEGNTLLGNKVAAVYPYGTEFPEVKTKDEEIPF